MKWTLDVLQRKLVRFVYGLDFRQHVGKKDLRNLSWLSIPDRVAFFKMMHLFRIRHNIAPKYLMPNFTSLSASHTHNTRGSSTIFVCHVTSRH